MNQEPQINTSPTPSPGPTPMPSPITQPAPTPAPMPPSQPVAQPMSPGMDSTPQPAPTPMMSFNTATTKLEKSPWDEPKDNKSLFGWIAFGLAALSLVVVVLLIFVTSLVKSEALVVTWLIVLAALAGGSLFLGFKSRNDQGQLRAKSLIAVIVSMIVGVNVLIVGSYYIKFQIELKKIEKKYQSFSTDDYNSTYSN